MAELAKSFITVSDESAYGAGTNAIVPLYVFATQGNKVLDTTTGEVAPGTTIANELLVMTSQRDVINTYGIPYFEEENGTVRQGSELNEVGLLGLYSAMGSSALAYALRADIDLSQLKPSKDEPRSEPKNGTKWFDPNKITFGAYMNNGKGKEGIYSIQNWDRIEVKIYDVITPDTDMSKEKEGTVMFSLEDSTFWEYKTVMVNPPVSPITTAAPIPELKLVKLTSNDIVFASHVNVPEDSETVKQGTIWIQTTTANDGTRLIKKVYNSTYATWVESTMKFYNQEEFDELLLDTEYLEKNFLDGANVIVGTADSSESKLNLKKYVAETKKFDDETLVWKEKAPSEPAAEGTLWYDDSSKVDIMINNGSKWASIKTYNNNMDLYVSADEPENPTSLSIWVDTNASPYPVIKRYLGEDGWDTIDNTDQTSALGVLFADARASDVEFEVDDDGKVTSSLIRDDTYDEEIAPDANTYPKGMILFNTWYSGKNVKRYEYNEDYKKYLWMNASGNAEDGSGLFGADAQRKMVVKALNGAINSCDELRSLDYDFFYACCPGYPEVDVALATLNSDKKEMFYIVSDTPKNLKPTVRAITDWGKERTPRTAYMTRQYPPMGLSSNVDGTSVAIPTSICKMRNLLNLPTGQICAGTQYGVVTNIGSTGYITDEDEYAVVSVNEGLGEAIVAQAMNPIMMRRNTGLLFWGENTENNGNTSLSDEHGVLTILRLKRELESAVQPFFFRKNTAGTRADFNYVLRTILNSYVANEEFYDYVLDTETPNTAETISRKELHAVIAVEIVKGIEFIYIPISVVNTGTLAEQSLIA